MLSMFGMRFHGGGVLVCSLRVGGFGSSVLFCFHFCISSSCLVLYVLFPDLCFRLLNCLTQTVLKCVFCVVYLPSGVFSLPLLIYVTLLLTLLYVPDFSCLNLPWLHGMSEEVTTPQLFFWWVTLTWFHAKSLDRHGVPLHWYNRIPLLLWWMSGGIYILTPKNLLVTPPPLSLFHRFGLYLFCCPSLGYRGNYTPMGYVGSCLT